MLKRVVDHEIDGKTQETRVYLGQAAAVKVYDKLGNVIAEPALARGVLARQVLVDANLSESHVGDFDPRPVWQQQEDGPNAVPHCYIKE